MTEKKVRLGQTKIVEPCGALVERMELRWQVHLPLIMELSGIVHYGTTGLTRLILMPAGLKQS